MKSGQVGDRYEQRVPRAKRFVAIDVRLFPVATGRGIIAQQLIIDFTVLAGAGKVVAKEPPHQTGYGADDAKRCFEGYAAGIGSKGLLANDLGADE